jgi:tetratricopeptide (TPR) repeat protein
VAVDRPEDEAKVRSAAEGLGLPVAIADKDVAGAYSVLHSHLFDRREDLRLPTLFLLDSRGEIVKLYREPHALAHVVDDLGRIEASPEARLARAVPFAGNPYSNPGERNYFQYGLDLSEQGFDAPALGAFERVAKVDPSAITFFNLGTLYMKAGRSAEAATAFQRALSLQPDHYESANSLGALLAQDGDVPGAIARFRAALEIRPDYPDALNNLGIVYGRSGDVDGAINAYRKALALTPNHTRAHYNLANAYRRKGLFDQAVDEYEKALQIKPNHPSARRNLIDVQARKRALDQEINSYEQSLAANPADAVLHNNLGELYGRKGMVEKSVFHYRQAMSIRPDYAPAYNNLAWVYATCMDDAQRNGGEAVRLATRACELTGFQNAGMLDTLAAAFAEAGDFNSAVLYQKKLLDIIQEKETTAARIRLRRYESGQPHRSY